jgi:hypothetical protein
MSCGHGLAGTPRPGDVPGYATRIALRELARRAQFPDTQIGHLDELIVPLVAGCRWKRLYQHL